MTAFEPGSWERSVFSAYGLALQTADWGLTRTARDAGTDGTRRTAAVTAGRGGAGGGDAVVAGGPAPR